MVIAEVKDGKPTGQEYPCTMISVHDGVIVGFEKPEQGTVIAPGDSGFGIYKYRTDWIMDSFTPFNGSVTLRNS